MVFIHSMEDVQREKQETGGEMGVGQGEAVGGCTWWGCPSGPAVPPSEPVHQSAAGFLDN